MNGLKDPFTPAISVTITITILIQWPIAIFLWNEYESQK